METQVITAIYARKSTEQTGVADDQKSVARQVEHARAYATAKGWTVDDSSVFVDDGISGAEFANRPGLVRLINALDPKRRRTAFQALIVSDLDRLGREQLETGYVLNQFARAGVRVHSYLEDREIALDSPVATFMMQVQAFGAALEREKARQRTYDAMARKAQQLHVTGGRVFGYDNVPIMLPGRDGQQVRRSHVERRIDATERRSSAASST
jgi:site-specific DNA recombinase